MMFGFDYIIGDPAGREKISRAVEYTVKVIVLALAVVGAAALLTVVCQICAW